jgi:hypothetical protein
LAIIVIHSGTKKTNTVLLWADILFAIKIRNGRKQTIAAIKEPILIKKAKAKHIPNKRIGHILGLEFRYVKNRISAFEASIIPASV